MTRAECEQQIKDKLLEIRQILSDYSDDRHHLSAYVGFDSIWAFRVTETLPPPKYNTTDIDIYCGVGK